jgi:hypothetical protein
MIIHSNGKIKSENRVLKRIFGPKTDEVKGGWRKLHNEELHNLDSSPSIIRMFKSRRMRWAGHIARMGRRGMNLVLYNVWVTDDPNCIC